jgi:hypothetical protein
MFRQARPGAVCGSQYNTMEFHDIRPATMESLDVPFAVRSQPRYVVDWSTLGTTLDDDTHTPSSPSPSAFNDVEGDNVQQCSGLKTDSEPVDYFISHALRSGTPRVRRGRAGSESR